MNLEFWTFNFFYQPYQSGRYSSKVFHIAINLINVHATKVICLMIVLVNMSCNVLSKHGSNKTINIKPSDYS